MAEPQRSKSESKRGSWIQEAFGRASVSGGRPSLAFGESDKAGAASNQAPPPIGSNVLVGAQQLKGMVRFVGSTNFASGIWVGVELDSSQGRNDGSVKGVRYFECKAMHGIFVRPAAVLQDDGANSELNISASLPVLNTMSSFNDIDDESDYEEKPQASSQRSSLLDIDEQDWAMLGSKLSQHLRSGRRESLRRKRTSDSSGWEDVAGADLGGEFGSEEGGAEASKTSSADLAELFSTRKEGMATELITGTPRATPRRRSAARPAPLETEEAVPAKPSRPPRNAQTLEIPTTRQSRSRPVSPNAEAPVMFSNLRKSVDLSAEGGPTASDAERISTGTRARARSTIDLTAMRKQAQQEKDSREKSMPPTSMPKGQDGLMQESLRSRGSRLQVPESPLSPGSLGAVLAVERPRSPTVRSPIAVESPKRSAMCFPISASDIGEVPEGRTKTQKLLAQAMEDHDVEQLRQLLPQAITLGVGASELECAQQILQFEVQRSLLHEVDGVRTCVALLSDALQKAEERAVAAERNSELSNERLSWSVGANGRSAKLTTPRDEAWLAQVVDRLERKVWEGLEWRVETIRTSVASATTELLSAVNEIKQLRGSLCDKAGFETSLASPDLPALQATVQTLDQTTLKGTLLTTDERFDADCEERFAGRSSRESSGQRATEDERAEELRILGEALGDSATASPRSAKPPLAPTGPLGRVRSRSPAAVGPRQKALLEKDAAVRLQKVERGRQARKQVSCLRQHGRRGHHTKLPSPDQGSMVREEIRQAAATVIQRSFRRRSRSIDSCDGLLRHERLAVAHGGRSSAEAQTLQLIRLIAREGEMRLGFVPSGLPPDRIFVESVDPGSWSSIHGLWEGDELIEVGGQGVLTMSKKDFTVEIKKRPLPLTFARDSQAGFPSLVGSRRPSSSSNTQTTSRRPSSSNTCNTGVGDIDGANEVSDLAVSGHFGRSDSEPMVNLCSDGRRSSWSSAGDASGQSPRAASPDRCDEAGSPLNMNLTLGSTADALLAEAEPDSPLRFTLQQPVDQSPRMRTNPLGVGPRQNVTRNSRNVLLNLPSTGDAEAVDGGRRQRSPLEELVDAQRGSATPPAASPAGGRSPTARSPMRSPRSPAEFLASLLQGSPHQMSPSSSGTALSPQKVGAQPASPASSSAQSPQKGKTELRETRSLDLAENDQSPQKPRSSSMQDMDSPHKTFEGLKTSESLESPQRTGIPGLPLDKAKRLELEALETDQRLGFSPWGFPPDRIYVTEVEDGLWADTHGVAPGDELIACNGQEVAKMRPRDFVVALTKSRPLQLTFGRGSGDCIPSSVSPRPLSASASESPQGTAPQSAGSGDTQSTTDTPKKDAPKRSRFRSRSSRLLGQKSPRNTPGPSPSPSPRNASEPSVQEASAMATDTNTAEAVLQAESEVGLAADSPAAAPRSQGLSQADSLSPTPPTESSLRLSLTPKDESTSRSLSQLETSAAPPSAESLSGIAFVAEKRTWSESPSSPKFAIQSDFGDSMRSRVSLRFPSDCGSPDWPHDSSPGQPVSPQPAVSPQISSSGCPAVGEPGWPSAGGNSMAGMSAASLTAALFGEKDSPKDPDIAEPLLQELQPEPPSFEPPGPAPEPDSMPPTYSFGVPRAVKATAATSATTAATAAAAEELAEPLEQSLTTSLPSREGATMGADEDQPPSSAGHSDKLTSEQRVVDAGSMLEEMTTTTETAWNWPPEDQEEEEEEEEEEMERF